MDLPQVLTGQRLRVHPYAGATTPGTFLVPPSQAGEMYSPEVFGCSSDWVIVE